MGIDQRVAEATAYAEIKRRARQFGSSSADAKRLAELDEERVAYGRSVLEDARVLRSGTLSLLLGVALTPIVHPKQEARSKWACTPRLLAALAAVNIQPALPLSEWEGAGSGRTVANVLVSDEREVMVIVGWYQLDFPWVNDYVKIYVSQPDRLGGDWHLIDESSFCHKVR